MIKVIHRKSAAGRAEFPYDRRGLTMAQEYVSAVRGLNIKPIVEMNGAIYSEAHGLAIFLDMDWEWGRD